MSRRYSSAAAAFGGGGPPQGPPRQQRAYQEEPQYRSREPAGRRGGKYAEEEPPAGYFEAHGRARHSQHEYAGVHTSQISYPLDTAEGVIWDWNLQAEQQCRWSK